MSHMIKFTLFVLLVVGLISGCAAPVPTATPTAAPTSTLPSPTLASPTVSVVDPAAVVQGFWDALKAQDLDAAMTFVADDIQCRGMCYLNGKESLRFFLQGRLETGIVFEIHDLQVEGDTVNYLYDEFSPAGFLGNSDVEETMRVQDGKIVYWEAN
jgi:limonene-1,2-epoxide hydrolase